MSDVAIMSSDVSEAPAQDRPARANLFLLWTSSFLVYFAPRRAAARWMNASLPAASIVAVFNLLLALPWLALVIASWLAFDESLLRKGYMLPLVEHPFDRFIAIFPDIPVKIGQFLQELDRIARYEMYLAVAMIFFGVLVAVFFVLLPFAARPGSNKACFRHTARAALLSTGIVHLASPLLAGLIIQLILRHTAPGFENAMTPLLVVMSLFSIWSLAALIRAVREDYRTPADMPQPTPPTCDVCGYDLRGSPPDGRCPECGKPVIESLGQEYRQPTAWERNPSLLEISVIVAQIRKLVFGPRDLFYNMPTRDGQRAAQRWLIASIVMVGFIAFWTIPGLWVVRYIDEWSIGFLAGGLAVGIVWALLGLMMVGIETAGVVAYGRLRKIQIEFAAAAKATCYSSTLMAFWAVLGCIQILALAAFWKDGNQSIAHFVTVHYSNRLTEGLSVGTFAIAQIVGLLWFEMTVYRGVRAIQWANR